MPTFFCRSSSFCCCSTIAGSKRSSASLHGLLRCDFVRGPAQVAFLAGKFLDEVLARHFCLVHAQIHDLALVAAHAIDQTAQAVAQRLDLLGAEADVHQFVRDLVARLQVGLAARAVLGQRAQHLAVEIADHREALERIAFEAQQVGGLHRGLFFLAHLFFFGFFLFGFFLFLGKLPRELVGGRIDQAVDHLVDADFVFFDAIREREDLGDRGRACRDRLDHVLQAVLDALRDLDFAFARQQLDRAHLAHIHAHRVGGTAEFGIDGGERRLGLLDHVLVGDRRRRIRHQQRFGIGRLVVDVDAHVVDHADDVFDLLGVQHVVGQVVVDLGVGQVAAILAEHDQVLQAHAARFGFDRRQFLALEFTHQRFFLRGQALAGFRLDSQE